MSKEELEHMFGLSFSDSEVEQFDLLKEAHEEGSKVCVAFARGSSKHNKVIDCFNMYLVFDEYIKDV